MRRINANDLEILEQDKQKRRRSLEKERQKKLRTKAGREQLKKKTNTDMKIIAEQYAQKLIMNATEAERHFYKILESLGINFKFQHPIYNKSKDGTIKQFYIPDFFLPDINTIVEIDGGYHFDVLQQKKDNTRTNKIKDGHRGIKVLRITNAEVFNGIKVMKFLQRILEREKTLHKT